jgi:hypothetical protein
VACAKNCKATGTGASKGYEGETAFFKIEVHTTTTTTYACASYAGATQCVATTGGADPANAYGPRAQAFDEFGNKCARGGENFKVQILEETPAERAVRKRREAEAKRKAAEAQKTTTTATTCTVTPDTAAPGDTTTTAAVEETCDTAAAQAGEHKSGAEEKEATKERLEVEEEKEKNEEVEEVEEEGVDSEKEEEDYRNRKPIVDAEAGEEEQQQHETQWLAYHDDEFWVCEECTLLNSKVRSCIVCVRVRWCVRWCVRGTTKLHLFIYSLIVCRR